VAVRFGKISTCPAGDLLLRAPETIILYCYMYPKCQALPLSIVLQSVTRSPPSPVYFSEYLTTQYLATQYLATQYLATQYLATQYLAATHHLATHLATHHLATQYLATQYLATHHLATHHLATQYLATQYLATQYLATQYLATHHLATHHPPQFSSQYLATLLAFVVGKSSSHYDRLSLGHPDE